MEVVIYKDKGKLIYENLNEMNNYLILVILLFCITGCKEKRPAIKEAVFEFNPNNILVCDTLDINQICDSFRYIPLETRDSVMIKELQMCKSGYSEMLEMYLRQIFIRLQRHFEQTIITDTSQIAEEIDKAIVYFSEHYNEAINVDAYAKQNHVSTNWFIRNFKMYTGTTPKQFILQKRINNAETLLQNKQYNIKEIAQIIGYDNPLYFSRIFQRTKGISPSEYRKNI